MAALNKKTIEDIEVKGKKVLVRCDFNVPLKDGVITNDKRIVASLPTIKYLLDNGAKVILCSHLGRPKGEVVPEFSLKPVAARLSELLGLEVKMACDVVGECANKLAADLKEGVEANQNYIHLMGAIDELTVLADDAAKPENAMAAVVSGIEVYLPLAGLIDVEKENQRLNKELATIDKELSRVEGKLGNAGFLAKAPADVIEKEKAKADELNGKKTAILERLEYLKTL